MNTTEKCSNLSLQDNFNLWGDTHKTRAIKEVFTSRKASIKYFDYLQTLTEVDFLKHCIIYSINKYDKIVDTALNEFIKLYSMDTRKKAKFIECYDIYSLNPCYTIQYNKINYNVSYRNLIKIKRQVLKEIDGLNDELNDGLKPDLKEVN